MEPREAALRSLLTETEFGALVFLAEAISPTTGRAVARALEVSPTTASAALTKLENAGFVLRERDGRSFRWQLNRLDPTIQSWLLEGVRDGPGRHDRVAMKVLVLTALSLECSAVLEHVEIAGHTHAGSYRLHQGSFQGQNISWSVYVAEIGAGNITAGVVLASIIPMLSPDLVLFVGVAGSLKPQDACRGDVVIPQHVFQLGAGKEAFQDPEGSVLLTRYIPTIAKTAVVQLARAVAHTDWINEQIRVRPDIDTHNGNGELPVAVIAPMAAGERVLTDDNSELVRGLRENLGDVVAVDMESAGVYSAAHAWEVAALSVRGISDHVIDKQQILDQQWQPIAAAHAASFAFAVLRYAGLQDIAGPSHPPMPEVPSATGVSTVHEMLFQLPPNVAVAYSWAERVGAPDAESMVRELFQHRHHASEWLEGLDSRMTDTDDTVSVPALFMLAEFAESHEHRSADLLLEQTARRTDQTATRGLLLARAAWSARLREGAERSDQFLVEATENLPEAETLWELFRSAFQNEITEVTDAALSVAASLGLRLPEFPEHPTTQDPSFKVLVRRMDVECPELIDLLRVLVAFVAANSFRIRREYASALRIYNALAELDAGPGDGHIVWDSLLGPRNSVLPLETARTIFMRISEAEPEAGVDVDLAINRALELALTSRDRRLDWNGPTGDALTLAAQLRARAGDAKGGLRLLLAPPQGTALDSEANSDQVLQVAPTLAFMTGDLELALQLARAIPDPIERRLMGGLVLASRADSQSEAASEFRAALMDPAITFRADQRLRALMGLTMVSELSPEDEVHLEGIDDATQDLIRAQSLVAAGRRAEAQVLMRPHRGTFPGLQMNVEVLVSQGRIEEAITALDEYATRHGEERILLQAAGLAISSGLLNDAERLASRVATSKMNLRRRSGLEILVEIAQQREDWRRVVQDTAHLLAATQDTDPDSDEARHRYRWARVNALFQLRDFENAYRELDDSPPLEPNSESEARLTIAILHAIAPMVPEEGAGLVVGDRLIRQGDILRRVSSIAKAFDQNEEIVAAALTTSLSMPARGPIDTADLFEARSLQDLFFSRFPESKIVRRVQFSSPEELRDLLGEQVAASSGHLLQMRKDVFSGQIPLALYAAAAQRSYAQGLVQNAVGVYVIEIPNSEITAGEVMAARDALDREVVIDTSSLFIAEAVFGSPRELSRRFERLVFPAPLRDDVLSARAAMALRSAGSFGWDPIEGQTVTSFQDEGLSERWAQLANRLAEATDICDVLPDVSHEGDPRTRIWSSAVRMAKERGLSLLADDAALRQLARSEGVPAFGTLQLLRALIDDGAFPVSVLDEALERLQGLPAVDLPVLERQHEIAQREEWQPTGYAAVLLTRPVMWMPPSHGLQQYMDLIRQIPGRDADLVAQWCGVASYGIALAVPSQLALVSVGSLVTWTTLEWRGPEILPRLLDVTRRVVLEFAPNGDLVQDVVQRLTTTLRQIVPPDVLPGLMQQLFTKLDDETRRRALEIFLTCP